MSATTKPRKQVQRKRKPKGLSKSAAKAFLGTGPMPSLEPSPIDEYLLARRSVRTPKSDPIRMNEGMMPSSSDEKKSDFVIVDVPRAPGSAEAMRAFTRSFFGDKTFRTMFASEGPVTTVSTGKINSAYTWGPVAALAEFLDFVPIFDEIFGIAFSIEYFPLSKYQYPVLAPPTTGISSAPFVYVNTFHGQTPYVGGSMGGPEHNPTHQLAHTGEHSKQVWVNNEKMDGGVATYPSTSSPVATQSWCLNTAANFALYTGVLQLIMSDVLGPGGGVTPTVGRVISKYMVAYRCRV